MSEEQRAPGWYLVPGMHKTLRFWDGDAWTNEMAPAPSSEGPDAATQIGTVAVGVIVGWFVIWLGAQVAPDVFYFPVKFVVEDLPASLR